MNFIGTFQTIDKLPQNAKDEDSAFIKDEQSLFEFKNGEWKKYFINQTEEEPKTATVKEFNQQIIKQIPVPSENGIRKDKEDIIKNFPYHLEKNDYFMLMSYDLKYFTLFNIKTKGVKSLVEEIFSCLRDLGQYLCYDINDNKAIEFWIKIEDEAYPIIFFNYNLGVIEI